MLFVERIPCPANPAILLRSGCCGVTSVSTVSTMPISVLFIRRMYQRDKNMKQVNNLRGFWYRSITLRYQSITPSQGKSLKKKKAVGTEVSHPKTLIHRVFAQVCG
jgi:hypothetical protein